MSNDFRAAEPADHARIRKFLAENGWSARMADGERFRRMMSGASRTVVAWEGDRIIGFGRALCDDASNGYLSMIAVAAGRSSRGFWEKLGFQPSEIAMERPRLKRDDSSG
jgi:hypothetical protein